MMNFFSSKAVMLRKELNNENEIEFWFTRIFQYDSVSIIAPNIQFFLIKLIYSERATKFCEISLRINIVSILHTLILFFYSQALKSTKLFIMPKSKLFFFIKYGSNVKLRHYEKATKIWNNVPLDLTLTK